MMIHKIRFVDNNKWLKRLDTQLNELINLNSIEVPKVDKPTNKKDFGNQSNKQPNVPSLPDNIH